jgi:hypothetical protein
MPDPQATTTTVSLTKKLEGARELRELIRRHRDSTDEARQLAPPVVEAMADSASSAPWCPPAPEARNGRGRPGCRWSKSSPPSMAQSAGMRV